MATLLGKIIGMSIMYKYHDLKFPFMPFIMGDKSSLEYRNNRQLALEKIEKAYLIDKILDEVSYSYAVEMINQIFDYYIGDFDSFDIEKGSDFKERKKI